jgi:hypothetical protein
MFFLAGVDIMVLTSYVFSEISTLKRIIGAMFLYYYEISTFFGESSPKKY